MEVGDRVVAADGATAVGTGEIASGYRYAGQHDLPHRRAVQWRSFGEWKLADSEGIRTTVAPIRNSINQVEVERRILEDSVPRERPSSVIAEPVTTGRAAPVPRFTGPAGLIQSILERKGQAVVYGPPGTGKTFWALSTTRELASLTAFGKSYASLTDTERQRVAGDYSRGVPLVQLCSFHPEYGYEDFIEGYRPKTSDNGQLIFSLEDGVFRRVCKEASRNPQASFYLIIDEINRGDIPRIFGELLTLLEKDKRGQSVVLPLSGKPFSVPQNVFLVGTMNTADRSIALLDVALRRRFGFVELMPDYGILHGVSISGLPLGPWLEDLNQRIAALGSEDARNKQIGHAYFLEKEQPISSLEQFRAILRDDVVPLLEEYCYGSYDQLAQLLGDGLIDREKQLIRGELFDSFHGTQLIQALSRPEIATASASVTLTQDDEPEEEVEASPPEDRSS
jgi:5-methylcytosine-specific restriction protein B